jgi:hypothetical protein
MSDILLVMIILFVVFVDIRTISYAVWNWKQKNKIGAVSVIMLSIISTAITMWVSIFIGKALY